MNLSMLLVIGGIMLALLSTFTKVPLWLGVVVLGVGIAITVL